MEKLLGGKEKKLSSYSDVSGKDDSLEINKSIDIEFISAKSNSNPK